MAEPRLARRRLAYAAMAGLLLMVAGALAWELSRPNADLLAALAYVLGGVVAWYMGVQIAPEVFKRNEK